jgi:hypothetical protein
MVFLRETQICVVRHENRLYDTNWSPDFASRNCEADFACCNCDANFASRNCDAYFASCNCDANFERLNFSASEDARQPRVQGQVGLLLQGIVFNNFERKLFGQIFIIVFYLLNYGRLRNQFS